MLGLCVRPFGPGFQGLGLEGVKDPKGINAAFEGLGMNPFI